jgi:hypothetical protein
MFPEKKTRLSVFLRAAAVVFALAAAGCSNVPPERPQFARLTYAHLGPFTFDAARIEIVEEPLASGAGVSAPVTPAQAARQWAQDRIRVTGQGNRSVRVVIRNAGIAEAELPRTGGLRGAFTKDQAQRFDAKVEMVVEVRNERGFQDGFATGTAERFTTVAEDITLNDRDRILFGLVEDLMRELNTRLDANIRSFLAGQLR